MKGCLADIETLTEKNTAFRQVLYTGRNLQLVLMAATLATAQRRPLPLWRRGA